MSSAEHRNSLPTYFKALTIEFTNTAICKYEQIIIKPHRENCRETSYDQIGDNVFGTVAELFENYSDT